MSSGKEDGKAAVADEAPAKAPNPFALISHPKDWRYYLVWTLQILAAPVLFPIRALLFCVVFYTVEGLLRLCSIKLEASRPIPRWRLRLSQIVSRVGTRVACVITGYSIEQRGLENRPDPDKALIVISNHTSAMDGIVYSGLGFTSLIAKVEVSKMPVFGTIVRTNQGLFVKREDKDSRRRCLLDIKRRTLESYLFMRGPVKQVIPAKPANSPKSVADTAMERNKPAAFPIPDAPKSVSRDITLTTYPDRTDRPWPCLFIFPESTTTNATALMYFKKGAFVSGVPVHPATIRYNQKYVDVSDCYQEAPVALLKTFLCFRTKVIVEYLPVYTPSAEERADPDLFACNVKKYMAKHLGIPALSYTYEDKRYYTLEEDDFSACTQQFRDNLGAEARGIAAPQPALWML